MEPASTIIGKIYDAAMGHEEWAAPLSGIADICGAENTAIVFTDHRLSFSSVVAPRADPDVVLAYNRFWWRHDPTAAATAAHPVGQLTTLADTGRDHFISSAFYNDYWRRSGLGAERVAANLLCSDGAFASCVLQASPRRDEISDEACQRFGLFVPHLARAAEIERKLRRRELASCVASQGQASGCVGTIIVDAAMRILFADRHAEAMFSRMAGDCAAKGAVSLPDAKADAKLRAAVAACFNADVDTREAGRICISNAAGVADFSVEIAPCRVNITSVFGWPALAAMLIFHDHERDRELRIAALRDRFELTQAEAALALEMLKGDGRAAAAKRCGISVNTARTHLSRIFEKTGVRRQAELIRLLLETPADPPLGLSGRHFT